jgi:hypothetical protein
MLTFDEARHQLMPLRILSVRLSVGQLEHNVMPAQKLLDLLERPRGRLRLARLVACRLLAPRRIGLGLRLGAGLVRIDRFGRHVGGF